MPTRNLRLQTQNYFVTGTDTGVGKTLVTALLALHFQACGVDAGVMKPFATGCRLENGVLVSDDALWLKQISGVEDTLELIAPACWREPLAPLVASRREGNQNDDHWSRCLDAYRTLCARHEIVLIEGVGGLLAPIWEKDGKIATCADAARTLALPVIVVARRTLGTINHSLLTVQALRSARLECAGLVFSDAVSIEENDVATQTSPAIIEEMSGLPILEYLPHLQDLSREVLREAARNFFGGAADSN